MNKLNTELLCLRDPFNRYYRRALQHEFDVDQNMETVFLWPPCIKLHSLINKTKNIEIAGKYL